VSLRIGIVGLPNVGKSTLFNALTNGSASVAAYPFTTIDPNRGSVAVPDARLDTLVRMVGPDVATPATVEFVDIAGLVRGAHSGEGLGNRFLSYIRTVDAIAVVSRCFSDPNVSHVETTVDPARDLEILDLELMLSDLEIVGRRLDKVQSAAKASPRQHTAEIQALQELQATLERGERVATGQMSGSTIVRTASDLSLLSAKKRVYVANVDESSLPDGGESAAAIARVAAAEGAPFVVLCAQFEAELTTWPLEDAQAYRAEAGLGDTGLQMLAWAGYTALDLVTFFTVVGGREVRAWAVRRGTTAPRAAGAVHSQMERGFIRAQVIGFDALADAGSWQDALHAGLVRTEGREYEIVDGDVCEFRFSP
jgi:GTP-binding protein YchF